MLRQSLLAACGLVTLTLIVAPDANAEEGTKHRSPPPEALQACSGLQDGAPCSFTHHDHQISGTCRTGPQGEAPACLPSGHPHVFHGPPPEALQACNGLTDGAACSFTDNGHEISGTCRTGPDGKGPACFPSHPPHPDGK